MQPHQDKVSKQVGSKHLLQSIAIKPVCLGHYALCSGQHVKQLPGSQEQELGRNIASRYLMLPCFSPSGESPTSQAPYRLSAFHLKKL